MTPARFANQGPRLLARTEEAVLPDDESLQLGKPSVTRVQPVVEE